MVRPMNRIVLLACWIPALTVLIATCLLLAGRTYPDYSLVDHDISFLGHPRMNPAGWGFWSAAMALGGVMLWPVATYISRAMRALTADRSLRQRRLAAWGAWAARCASIGMFGLALVPQLPGLDPPHQLAGVMAMGGLYVALWLFVGILIASLPIGPMGAVLLIAAVAWGPIGFLATQGWRFFRYGELGHDAKVTPQLPLLQFSLWEWLLYFCLFVALPVVVWQLRETNSR